MEVGELISYYRKQAEMTIDELAEKSKVPKGTLNKIIGGVTKAPTLDNMKAIAKALGKRLADFEDEPDLWETKKSPGAPNTAPRDNVSSIFNYLNDALVSAGYIKADEDLTDQQANVLIGICTILRATFNK